MQLVELTTEDGFLLQGPYWPTNSKAAVIFLHGSTNFYDPELLYAGATERFFSRAGQFLSDNGIAALAVRNRGSGRPEFFNDCIYDIQAYIDLLKEEGYQQIILAGHSLGGSKAAYYVGTKTNHQLSGLILMSCCPAIHSLYSRTELLEKSRDMQARGEGALFFGYEVNGILNWQQPNSYLQNYEQAYQKDTSDILQQITLPILSFAMEKEPKWFQQITNEIHDTAKQASQVDTHIFPGVESHMYTDTEEAIARYIANWVNKLN